MDAEYNGVKVSDGLRKRSAAQRAKVSYGQRATG